MRAAFSIAATILLVSIVPSVAGGLVGKGGLIRGDVGRALDPIENKVTTPAARKATVAGASAVGGAVGAYFGAPQTGAAVGGYVGNTINERAAGQSPAMGRPYYSRGSGTTSEGTRTLTLSNSTNTTYYARVYSRSRSAQWPADGSWRIDPGAAYNVTLQCTIGEMMCFGSTYVDGTETGVGLYNKNICTDCCRKCGGEGRYASN